MNWLGHVLGLDNVSGPWYAFWSGVAGDLGIVGAALTLVRKQNCHVRGCWRIGRHPTETGWVVCRKHHPSLPDRAPSAEEL